MAIAKTADVLRRTFRDSDIVARLGGDEFAVLAQNASLDDTDHIIARLAEDLRTVNEQDKQGYRLSLSVGAVLIDHDSNLGIDQLIGKADKAMYDHKRSKKQWSKSMVYAGFEPTEDSPSPAW